MPLQLASVTDSVAQTYHAIVSEVSKLVFDIQQKKSHPEQILTTLLLTATDNHGAINNTGIPALFPTVKAKMYTLVSYIKLMMMIMNYIH